MTIRSCLWAMGAVVVALKFFQGDHVAFPILRSLNPLALKGAERIVGSDALQGL